MNEKRKYDIKELNILSNKTGITRVSYYSIRLRNDKNGNPKYNLFLMFNHILLGGKVFQTLEKCCYNIDERAKQRVREIFMKEFDTQIHFYDLSGDVDENFLELLRSNGYEIHYGNYYGYGKQEYIEVNGYTLWLVKFVSNGHPDVSTLEWKTKQQIIDEILYCGGEELK